MKKDDYWRKPKNAKGGWWYANKGSIDVVAERSTSTIVRISRPALVAYLRRSAKGRRD